MHTPVLSTIRYQLQQAIQIFIIVSCRTPEGTKLNSCDVIIVGAGPAGSVAAINLSEAGYHVIVVEKNGISRNKVCGGGITPRVLTRFPYLKNDVEATTISKTSEVCLYSPSLNIIRSPADCLMVERAEFDAMLTEKCRASGAMVVSSSKVVKMKIDMEAAQVLLEDGSSLTARAIIGADGINSLTARSTRLRRKTSRSSTAVCLVREVAEEPDEVMRQKTMYIFYDYGRSSGYGWVFPKKRCINVGIGVLAHDRINIKDLWKNFVAELKKKAIISDAFVHDQFESAILPANGPLPKTYSDGVLLCGDAGGFVNSFTGEGIYYAMVSGEIAASVLAEALKKNELSEKTMMNYQRLWKSEIGTELERAFQISRVVLKRPDLVEKIIAVAAKKPEVKKILTDYCIGTIAYQDLKKSLIRRVLPLCARYKIEQFFNKRGINPLL